jgi:hypothetical protein
MEVVLKFAVPIVHYLVVLDDVAVVVVLVLTDDWMNPDSSVIDGVDFLLIPEDVL